jgi:uncharacterized protein YeaO (DUF488 family)
MIRIKRAYEPKASGDGRRIFVERLWPRGLTKDELAADAWLKEVAPSTRLRQRFDHRVERWSEFRRRYRRELDANPGAWEPILAASRRGTVTLLYAAHDKLHNGAVVLREYLADRDSGRDHRAQRSGHRRETATAREPSVTEANPRGARRRALAGRTGSA